MHESIAEVVDVPSNLLNGEMLLIGFDQVPHFIFDSMPKGIITHVQKAQDFRLEILKSRICERCQGRNWEREDVQVGEIHGDTAIPPRQTFDN